MKEDLKMVLSWISPNLCIDSRLQFDKGGMDCIILS